MKPKIIITLVIIMTTFIWQATAQTNDTTEQATNKIAELHDYRIVNGEVYDVLTSKKWVSITIPAGSSLLDQGKIHFTGTVQPINIIFSIPVAKYAANTTVIHNFPYDPKYFYRRTPYTGIETRLPLNLKVFPLDTPKTNWTALGEMKITPARSIFDYGLPTTNEPAVNK